MLCGMTVEGVAGTGVAPVRAPACERATLTQSPRSNAEFQFALAGSEEIRTKVTSRPGAWMHLRDSAMEEGELVGRTDNEPVRLNWDDIERIDRSGRGPAVAGALVGGGIGFLLGFAADEPEGAILSLGLGVAVGALVGGLPTRWIPIYCSSRAGQGDE